MKTPQLLILRHAKSDWVGSHLDDFDRPLSTRGANDAPRIGQWLVTNKFEPDLIMSSPALRAKQTVQAIVKELEYPQDKLIFDKNLYLADLQNLLNIIAQCSSSVARLLIAGHNPGLETLLKYLCTAPLPHTKDGKLLTTANLAVVSLSCPWNNELQAKGKLVQFVRPCDLNC
ncbi:MAG: histidine phosphatase family protein [Gammaproteobacteria bacterium]|nr:histidine phosphatase family protein [Gammaproteobacteria bacterium]